MDDASGIATLLETAASFKASRRRPKRSLVFLAVTAEEKGCSAHATTRGIPPFPRRTLSPTSTWTCRSRSFRSAA